jgi:hypothetical protein
MTKYSPVTNRKRLSKSSSANPRVSEGIGMCRNELVWKHCEISICLSNSCAALAMSRLLQAPIKSLGRRSQEAILLGGTPYPAKQSAPSNRFAFPLQSTYRDSDFAIINLGLLDDVAQPWFPFSGTVLSIDRNVRQD